MVLGKAKWFKMRKYGGWGIHPKTWQGWVYLGVMIIPFLIFQYLPYWSNFTKNIVTGFWVTILLIDVIDIMIHLKKDEREEKHEALSDRNAVWAIVMILALGLVLEIIYYGLKGEVRINYVVLIALLFGALVKTGTFIYLERKN